MVGYMLHIKILREKERDRARERTFDSKFSLFCLKISLWERCTIFYATSKTSQVRIVSKSTLTALHEFGDHNIIHEVVENYSLFVARSGNRCWCATRAFEFFPLNFSQHPRSPLSHRHVCFIPIFRCWAVASQELKRRSNLTQWGNQLHFKHAVSKNWSPTSPWIEVIFSYENRRENNSRFQIHIRSISRAAAVN